MLVYLDCNATTPVAPRVAEAVVHAMTIEYGNSGSRTHEFGVRALKAVQRARDQVAAVVDAKREEVIFTSGATESNNIAILGLEAYGRRTGKRHIVSTMIEHKAVLEPLEALERRGFEVTLVPPTLGGWIDPDTVGRAMRPDTLLVSIMHVNNETGVLQPLGEICDALRAHPAFLHVDAAQGFGKELTLLRSTRIDLISLSGHKIHAPQGVGALIIRRRGFDRAPLEALVFGGGQERGIRPGTVPVPLVVGLGVAAELALEEAAHRRMRYQAIRAQALAALLPLGAHLNGDAERMMPHTLSVSFDGIDSEALMVALRGTVACSNGSACTSHSYQPSHVLKAMGLPEDRVQGAIRLSWCHMTEDVNWQAVATAIRALSPSLKNTTAETATA